MDPRVAQILKLAVFGALALVAFGIGSKHYKRHARKTELLSEIRTLVSEASFYRSLGADQARATLLRGAALLDEAKSLGLEPSACLDLVFQREPGPEASFDEFADFPIREKMARETLLRTYQHATQLNLFDAPDARAALAAGSLPEISPKPTIVTLIDPAISPGLEKVVPNLELRPAGAAAETATDIGIAAALNLAADLCSARIIDHEAEQRIRHHFRPQAEK
jgi:hypothetical protein